MGGGGFKQVILTAKFHFDMCSKNFEKQLTSKNFDRVNNKLSQFFLKDASVSLIF